MNQQECKRLVARAALQFIEEGSIVGIGTGSTVNYFIEELAGIRQRVEATVSSSSATTKLLRDYGFEIRELNSVGDLPLYVDGADEATKHRQLVKGGGGALTREKVLAAAARRFLCIVDESKLVGVLGGFPLPIEVIPMAQAFVARQMVKAGGTPIWRHDFTTDNGNHILDVHNLKILNPVEIETRFNQIPGIVTVGLFARRPADVLLVGGEKGVRRLEASTPPRR